MDIVVTVGDFSAPLVAVYAVVCAVFMTALIIGAVIDGRDN